MGIIARIGNIFKSKVNSALDSVENPVELLSQKIINMEEQLNKATTSAATVLGNVHAAKKSLERAKSEVSDYDAKVKLALEKNKEELARKALQRKLEAEKRVKSLQKNYDNAVELADRIKSNIDELRIQLDKTRSYRDEAVARYENAKASEIVNATLANVKNKNDSIQLDNIERRIQEKENKAAGLADLRVDTLEDEFAALGASNLNEELAKYKEAMKN